MNLRFHKYLKRPPNKPPVLAEIGSLGAKLPSIITGTYDYF